MPGFLAIALAGTSIFTPEFVNLPALLLTLGGAVLVVLCSYPQKQIQGLIQSTKALCFERSPSIRDHMSELTTLTEYFRLEGLKGLESREHRIVDPFLRRSVSMLIDLQKEDQIRATLEGEMSESISRDEMSCRILLTLGKLLPAFGLIGTLIGMVMLLHNLYAQDIQSLPQALSLAVLTTLYGAVFANILVAPLGARLGATIVEKEKRMGLTLEWAMMIIRGDNTANVSQQRSGRHLSMERQRLPREPRWRVLFPSLQ